MMSQNTYCNHHIQTNILIEIRKIYILIEKLDDDFLSTWISGKKIPPFKLLSLSKKSIEKYIYILLNLRFSILYLKSYSISHS
jgi:hypothetical protein